MRKRIAYSQNFLTSRGLIAKLLDRSSISEKDVVYEIGTGQGIITEELLKKAKRVVAFEIDENLFKKLSYKYQNEKSLDLRRADFLTATLPRHPYKVFSNIPFNITSEVIKKLTFSKNSPRDAYLVVQNEAAKKFIGQPYVEKNSQVAVLLKPWYELSVVHRFDKNDFFPVPRVETVLLWIQKRDAPLVRCEDARMYDDFIVYAFNQFKANVIEGLAKIFGKQAMIRLADELGFSRRSKPSELKLQHWLGLFNYFLKYVDEKRKNIVRGSSEKLFEQQKKLEKIHRTRVDKGWRKYKQVDKVRPCHD